MAGSYTKIGNKYRVTLELGTDENGKRLRKYVTVTKESEAKKIINEFEYNKQRNLLVKFSEMKIREFIEHWMDNYVKFNCEETTIYGYRNIINNHILPYLGEIKLQELHTMHIQQYYKQLMELKKLSSVTVHKHHAVLRKALDYALKHQLVYRNVADAVSLPKKERFKGKTYTKEQLNKLLEMVVDTKLELPVFLGGYLGLRRGEITGLKWKNVDLENRLVHVHEVRTSAGEKVIIKKPKSEKSRRSIYIVDELYEVLIKHKNLQSEYKKLFGKEYQNTGYVVVREDGKPYRVNTVTEQFKKFLEDNNLPQIRLHDLRHTFSSILYNEGVDLKAISEVLGHSDISTTNSIYTHLFDVTHKKTVSVMSKALRK